MDLLKVGLLVGKIEGLINIIAPDYPNTHKKLLVAIEELKKEMLIK